MWEEEWGKVWEEEEEWEEVSIFVRISWWSHEELPGAARWSTALHCTAPQCTVHRAQCTLHCALWSSAVQGSANSRHIHLAVKV